MPAALAISVVGVPWKPRSAKTRSRPPRGPPRGAPRRWRACGWRREVIAGCEYALTHWCRQVRLPAFFRAREATTVVGMRPALLLSLVALLALAPSAAAKPYDVPAELGGLVGKVAKKTDVGVRLPKSLDLDFDGAVHGAGSGAKRSFELSLSGAPGCGGANACFLASFTGEKGGTPAFRRKVALTGGRTGYYKPLTCGGSCSPPMIQWVQNGVLYGIQAKVEGDARKAMVRAANSAITRSPR